MKVTFGDKEFAVSALNWNQLEELQPEIATLNSMQGGFTVPSNRAAALKVVLACIKRKHPEVSEDYIRDNLDLGNVTQAIAAAFAVNGFKEAAPGEARAAASAT